MVVTNKKIFSLKFNTILFWFLSALIVSGVFWHLQAVWHQELFGDEIHSLFFFQNNSWWNLISSPLEPIHPNGVYLLLKALYVVTPTVIALRFWQFVIFLASCMMLWQIFQKLQIRTQVAMLGLALWVSSAYLWHFSFQLRMYGPAFLVMLLSTLFMLKKKLTWAIFLDWSLLLMVYGGGIFLLAKWFAYLLLALSNKNCQKKYHHFRTALIHSLFIIVPLALIFLKYLFQQHLINESYLYWVKAPVWQDWSLGVISLMSGLFLPYFEGYADLNSKWLQLGGLVNALALMLLFTISIITWIKRRLCFDWWKNSSFNAQFIVAMWIIIMVFYTGLHLWSMLFGSHLFHIRQIFPVGIVSLLMLVWVSNQIWYLLPKLVSVVAVILIVINQTMIIQDSLGSNQTYVHHFTDIPGTPLLASKSDIELIYKLCGTFDQPKIESECKRKNITFVESKSFILPTEQSWWLTKRANSALMDKHPDFSDKYDCKEISVDFLACQALFR